MSRKNIFNLLSIVFILLLFYIFLAGIGSYSLLAKDEPRYAGCALEMIENKNWIVPKFNFQDRFDKPILYYWMIGASYVLLGVNEFSSRLPSALCAIFLVLFTWYTVKKVLGNVPGFISAVILATSVEYLYLGRRAATDIALCLFFSGALYSLYLGYFIKDWKVKIFWTIISGVFAGLAMLTKGPIGLVLMFGILTLFLIARKQFDARHLKVYFLITAVALLISLPWYVKVHLATGGEFTKVFFFTHNFERFTSVVGEHPGPFWFYFPVILLGFMPWTLFFIPALIKLSKRLAKPSFNRFILFCLIWAAIVFLFFSVCKTKMATYILLLFPPIAIITGYWVNILGRGKTNVLKTTLVILLLILSICLLISNFVIPQLTIEPAFKTMLLLRILISFSCLAIGIIILSFFARKHYALITVFVVTLAIPGVMLLSTGLYIFQKITFGDLIDFAKLARASGAREIISFGDYKPILVYYGRIPVDFNVKKEQLTKMRKLLSENKETYVIGYLSDISKDKPNVQKNKDLFDRLQLIKSGKRYFLGKLS